MTVPSLASRPFLNTRPVWLVTAICGILAVVLLVVNVNLYFRSTHLLTAETGRKEALKSRELELTENLRREAGRLKKVPWKALETRVEMLNRILRSHAFSWTTMLADLGDVLPYGVRLITISPSVGDEGGELSLSGTAKTRQAMLELLQNMIDDPRFEGPLPRTEQTPESTQSQGYDFNLRVTYRPWKETP